MEHNCLIYSPMEGNISRRAYLHRWRIVVYCGTCGEFLYPGDHYRICCYMGRSTDPTRLWPFTGINGGKVGYFEEMTGQVKHPPRWEDGRPFYEGRAAVKENGKWGFIDKYGNMVIPAVYEPVDSYPDYHSAFDQGIALVKKNGLHGIIDTKGNEIVPIKWKAFADFKERKSFFPNPKKWNDPEWNKGFMFYAFVNDDECAFFSPTHGLHTDSVKSCLVSTEVYECNYNVVYRTGIVDKVRIKKKPPVK